MEKRNITVRLSDEMEVMIKKTIKKTNDKSVYAFILRNLREYLDNAYLGEAILSERPYLRDMFDDVVSAEHTRIEKMVQAIEDDYIFVRENEDLYD